MLGTKVNFKKAKTPLSKKILGDYVVLEPINPTKHVTQLFNNFYQDKECLRDSSRRFFGT